MYEADYLREQIGLEFPSIFDFETKGPFIDLPEKQLKLKTWALLIKLDINTTPIGILTENIVSLVSCEGCGHIYRPTLLEGLACGSFYDYQVSGAIGLLLKLLGKVNIRCA